MKNLLLIKLGGSVVTDKTKEFTSNEENIIRFAKEIRDASKTYKGKIVIGHGAGSFAHTPATRYQTKKGLINKESLLGMSIVEDAARQLNAIIVKNFINKNVAVFPFSPGSFLISDNLKCKKSYLDPIIHAMEIGQTPIIYGDVIIDKSLGCTIFSTEKVFEVLAKELNKKFKIRMIYVTDVDGVYDVNKKTIPVITNKNFSLVRKSIIGLSTKDVTGGMLHKVEEALTITKKYKIKAMIINGNVNGNLQKAIEGKLVIGTKIN